MTLKQELRSVLTEKELAVAPSAFDVLGSKAKAVAIIEIPPQLEGKENAIAEALMRKHKNVKTVLKKLSDLKGIFRVRDYEILAGDSNTEVMHVESGCRFLLDPKRCYFSQREATERLRIAEKVNKNDVVMVFFSGVGPYCIIIAKKSKPRKVIGIEINDKAVLYARENAKLNKMNVETIFGDARHESRRFWGKCDRVIMPLPGKSVEYLEDAIKCLKNKGVIHFYCFVSEGTVNEKKEELTKLVKSFGFHASVIETRKVLPYKPRIWNMRFDLEIRKRSSAKSMA